MCSVQVRGCVPSSCPRMYRTLEHQWRSYRWPPVSYPAGVLTYDQFSTMFVNKSNPHVAELLFKLFDSVSRACCRVGELCAGLLRTMQCPGWVFFFGVRSALP